MSGAGRKGVYRKGVTEDVINGTPLPEENEFIAQVKAPRGGNVLEILCSDGSIGLAILPAKFRKLLWVKRGDYLIVSGDDEYTISSEASSGVSQFRVEHILYKDQVRHIKNNGLWPHLFEGNNDESRHGSIEETSSRMTAPMGPTTSEAPAANSKKLVIGANDFGLMDDAEMEGSESEEEEAGAELFVNTNRRQMKPAAPDSSSDEDEEE